MAIEIGTRFCALEEHDLAGVNGACKWPMRDVGIYTALNLPQVAADVERQVFQRIADAWNAVCNLNLHLVPAANQANIYSQSGPIDGRNGVLGQSYLPCGGVNPNTQLAQLFDNAEPWAQADLLFRVGLHEVGHALGLDHAPQGSGAIMEPFLTNLTSPQPWDIEQMQARYGPPVTNTTPAPTPTPSPTPTPAPTPTPVGPTLVIPEPGNYLLRIDLGGMHVNVVHHIPVSGTFPYSVSATRR